jgi:hypothetical protein
LSPFTTAFTAFNPRCPQKRPFRTYLTTVFEAAKLAVQIIIGTTATLFPTGSGTQSLPASNFYSIEFRDIGRHRCVPLFEGTSTLSSSYGNTKYMLSSVPGRAFLGVCTNAPLREVDSVFGSQNRMFMKPLYNELNGRTNWYPFAASSLACDCNPALQSCANFSSYFSDLHPDGFDSITLWKNFVFLNAEGGVCSVNKL